MWEELIRRLSRYGRKCVADALDPDFADAVQKVKSELSDARNELCYHCGGYRNAHMGYCDDCRWRSKL